jgi:hypothetical protein
MIFAELQETNGETFLVITAVAPKDPNQIIPTEVPNFTIFIDNSWNTHDYITPAITDITTRTFTEDQIKLITECPEAPNHLTVQTNTKIEASHAANENLILITKEPESQQNELTILNTTTGQEFKTENQIELTDALCDFVKPLKVKTMANLTLKVTKASDLGTLELETFENGLRKETDDCKISLLDMGSEAIQKAVLRVIRNSGQIQVSFSFDDLILMRTLTGGIHLG